MDVLSISGVDLSWGTDIILLLVKFDSGGNQLVWKAFIQQQNHFFHQKETLQNSHSGAMVFSSKKIKRKHWKGFGRPQKSFNIWFHWGTASSWGMSLPEKTVIQTGALTRTKGSSTIWRAQTRQGHSKAFSCYCPIKPHSSEVFKTEEGSGVATGHFFPMKKGK